MIESEHDNSRLRDVIDYGVDFMRRSIEAEVAEEDRLLAEKDAEIASLKAKIAENGLE